MHRIFNRCTDMSAKIKQLAYGLVILLMFASCSEGPYAKPNSPDGVHPEPPYGFIGLWSDELQHKERDDVFKDTITPPSNPMMEVPRIPGAFTFRGVLALEYFKGELYCAVRAINNNYFMTDNATTYLMRLDNPQLSSFAVGDTIIVTARPMKLLNDYSLATYFVQPNSLSDDE